MFAMTEYEEYQRLQKYADNLFKMDGETEEQKEAQAKADAAFENWEYEAGIRVYED